MRKVNFIVAGGACLSGALSMALTTGIAYANNPVSYGFTLPDGRPGAAELTHSEAFTSPPPPPCPADHQIGFGGYGDQHDFTANPHGYCGGEEDCYSANGYDHYHAVENCSTSDYDLNSGCHRPCPTYYYSHRFGHSSFALTTKIMKADKTYQPAMRIQAGDTLWNPVRNAPVRVRKVVIGFEAEAMLDLVFDQGSTLRVSQRHPMVMDQSTMSAQNDSQEVGLVRASLRTAGESPAPITFGNYVMRQARSLKVGDSVLASDGQMHKLVEIKVLPIKADQKVVNIELDGPDNSPADHMVLSEGLVTGDYLVQLKINSSDKD